MYFTTVYFLRRRLFFDDGLGVIKSTFDPFYITFDAYVANPFSLPYDVSFEKIFLSLDYAEMHNPLSIPIKSDFGDNEINMNLIGRDAKSPHIKTDLEIFVKDDYLMNMSPPLPVRHRETFTGNLHATVGSIKFGGVVGEIKANATMFIRMLLMAMKYLKFESEYFVSMDVNLNLNPTNPIKVPDTNLGEISYEMQIGFVESEAIKTNESLEMDFISTMWLLYNALLSHYANKTLSDISGTKLSDMKYILKKE